MLMDRADHASWIGLTSPAGGQGDGSVPFKVAANDSPASRDSGVMVNDERLQVAQQGRPCEFQLSSEREAFGAEGGERTIQVNASSDECGWTAASSAPWIAILSGQEGRGSAAVSFRVDAATGPQRTGSLTIAGRTVQVEQGGGCAFAVAPGSLSVGPPGGMSAVQVHVGDGCPWTVRSADEWIRITSAPAGSGTARVDIMVAANPGPQRTGSVTIAGERVAIVQASGCSYAISPESQNAAGSGATGLVSVATAPGCPWTAAAAAGWVTLSPTSGMGPGDVRFTVAPNLSPPRTTTLLIAGRTAGVIQSSQCTYTLLPPFHDFGPEGGNGNVLVILDGPCTWTAQSQAPWITMTAGLSGTGNGLVQFVVPPNDGPARTGFVKIAEQQYRVSQTGQTGVWSFEF
jgi:hypothetical protein